MEDSPKPGFSVRWARRWGIALMAGALLPAGGWPGMLLVVAIAALLVGAWAVFFMPRLSDASSLPAVALGGTVGTAFLVLQIVDRRPNLLHLEPGHIQALLLLGFGTALIAAANHLRKQRISRRSRWLSAAGGAMALLFFLLPVGDEPPLVVYGFSVEAWTEFSYIAMPLLTLFLYCGLGVLGAVQRSPGREPGMSALVRVLLIAAPVVPIAGEMVREGGSLEFAVVALVLRVLLVMYGMFGLLATGLVEWFQEPGDLKCAEQPPSSSPS